MIGQFCETCGVDRNHYVSVQQQLTVARNEIEEGRTANARPLIEALLGDHLAGQQAKSLHRLVALLDRYTPASTDARSSAAELHADLDFLTSDWIQTVVAGAATMQSLSRAVECIHNLLEARASSSLEQAIAQLDRTAVMAALGDLPAGSRNGKVVKDAHRALAILEQVERYQEQRNKRELGNVAIDGRQLIRSLRTLPESKLRNLLISQIHADLGNALVLHKRRRLNQITVGAAVVLLAVIVVATVI